VAEQVVDGDAVNAIILAAREEQLGGLARVAGDDRQAIPFCGFFSWCFRMWFSKNPGL